MDKLTLLLAGIMALQPDAVDAQTMLDEAKAAAKKEGYDVGFTEGVASVKPAAQLPVDASVQEQIDAAVAPLNEQVAALQTQVSDLQSKVASKDKEIADALANAYSTFAQELDALEGEEAKRVEELKAKYKPAV